MLTLRSEAASAVAALAIIIVAGSLVANKAWKDADIKHRAEAMTGGNAERGQELFVNKGCGGCHSAQGVAQANGLVGPPVDGIAVRAIIAGKLANTPDNMAKWISSPQSVVPGNAMPDMPMTAQEGRDLTAFLYTRV